MIYAFTMDEESEEEYISIQSNLSFLFDLPQPIIIIIIAEEKKAEQAEQRRADSG